MVHLGGLGERMKLSKGSKNSTPIPSRVNSPRAFNDSSLVLNICVVSGRDLAAKDKNGFSDPYVVVSMGEYSFTTPSVNKNLNPTWNANFEMALSGCNSFVFHCVCWDKDRFGRDYMGEFKVSLDEVFKGSNFRPEAQWHTLKCGDGRKGEVSGDIKIAFSLVDSAASDATPEELQKKWTTIVNPRTPGLAFDLAGQGLTETPLASDNELEEEESSEEAEDATLEEKVAKKERKERKRRLRLKRKKRPYEFASANEVVGLVFLEVGKITDLPPEKNVTRTGFDMDPFVVVSLGKKVYRTRVIRHSLNPVFDEKMVFQVAKHEQNYSLNFAVVDRDKLSGNDFVAQANFELKEIKGTEPAADEKTGLYSLREPSRENLLSTGPNRSRFRLPLSRSSSSQSLSKLGKNGSARPENHRNVSAGSSNGSGGLLHPERSPTFAPAGPAPTSVPADMQPQAKIAAAQQDQTDYLELTQYTIPLPLKNKDRWEDKHNPELIIKAKYMPYSALRQQFWRVMLKQYDSDDSGLISKVELTTMLDTLGSTLKEKTIDSFYQRFEAENAAITKANGEGELTMDQAVICLEDQLSMQSKSGSESVSSYFPSMLHRSGTQDSTDDNSSPNSGSAPDSPTKLTNDTSQLSLDAPKTQTVPPLGAPGEEGAALDDADDLAEGKGEEHVIMISECPLCQQPRLNKRSEVDIVTHLATCVSQDWRKVDRLVMGGFVTSSQAQRKWYSKVISKISYGGYKLGANSANILVQDRITGLIQEERMSVYVRLGIRLLYKGLKSSSMETKRIRKLLYSLSIKQGKKFDNPASARDIQPFIQFHQLDMSEVRHPLDSFKNFNEFFYRELKEGARPCAAPDNSKIVVSPADCRSVVFDTIEESQKIWIKGREFSVERLLGAAYPEDAARYKGGALGIFRLAPQDYHRFHIPVDGLMGEPRLIKGEYYTVNPMAIRSALDVYGENVRIVVPIDSPDHGRVMVICVGAMMVGSTVITAKPNSEVKRTDELGYFQFGGSTLVLLFEPGKMNFDDDLVANSKSALETLIRVGMAIGHTPDAPAVGLQHIKANVSAEDKAAAKRRIEGSLAPPPSAAIKAQLAG